MPITQVLWVCAQEAQQPHHDSWQWWRWCFVHREGSALGNPPEQLMLPLTPDHHLQCLSLLELQAL